MEYVTPAVETLKPYDLSASKLIKGFGLAGTIGALLLGFVLILAIKLRLLSKLGYYLGSVRKYSLSHNFLIITSYTIRDPFSFQHNDLNLF